MRRLIVFVAMAGLIFAAPASAADNPTGFGASVMLGANICVEQGDPSCEGVDPSFGFTIGGVWRSSKWWGLTMDFYYGMYDTPVDISNMGIIVGPRIYIPIGNLALFAGLGAGWGRYAAEFMGETRDNNHLVLAFQVGGEFYIFDQLGLGAWMRWHMPLLGEDEGDFSDYTSEVMVGAGATYYF